MLLPEAHQRIAHRHEDHARNLPDCGEIDAGLLKVAAFRIKPGSRVELEAAGLRHAAENQVERQFRRMAVDGAAQAPDHFGRFGGAPLHPGVALRRRGQELIAPLILLFVEFRHFDAGLPAEQRDSVVVVAAGQVREGDGRPFDPVFDRLHARQFPEPARKILDQLFDFVPDQRMDRVAAFHGNDAAAVVPGEDAGTTEFGGPVRRMKERRRLRQVDDCVETDAVLRKRFDDIRHFAVFEREHAVGLRKRRRLIDSKIVAQQRQRK